MLSDEQVERFERDGFVAGPRVLSDEAVEVLRAELHRVIEQRERPDVPQPVLCHNMGRDGAPIWQIVKIWMASEPFRNLVADPLICGEVAQLHAGVRSLRIWHDQIQYKPAGKGGVNMWHQDSLYWGILTPKDAQVTAWIALDDVDEDNGCMSMVPGSHHWGHAIDYLRTLRDFDQLRQVKEYEGHRVEVVPCPVKKGHVHYHHSLTWHGSHANRSQRPRRAIALHYMTGETRYIGGGEHLMKQFVTVADGQPLEGEHFPVVWQRPEQ